MRWRDGAGAQVVGSEDPENANCHLILRVDIAAFLHLCLLMSIIQFAYCLLCGICTCGATITLIIRNYLEPYIFGTVARNKSKLFAIYNSINVVYLAKNVEL